jgi:histone H3/H4
MSLSRRSPRIAKNAPSFTGNEDQIQGRRKVKAKSASNPSRSKSGSASRKKTGNTKPVEDETTIPMSAEEIKKATRSKSPRKKTAGKKRAASKSPSKKRPRSKSPSKKRATKKSGGTSPKKGKKRAKTDAEGYQVAPKKGSMKTMIKRHLGVRVSKPAIQKALQMFADMVQGLVHQSTKICFESRKRTTVNASDIEIAASGLSIEIPSTAATFKALKGCFVKGKGGSKQTEANKKMKAKMARERRKNALARIDINEHSQEEWVKLATKLKQGVDCLSFQKAAFRSYVKHVATVCGVGGLRFGTDALNFLQQIVETHILFTLANAAASASGAKQNTLLPKHINPAKKM